MGVSKVNLGDETLIDLTADTVSSSNLLSGYTAHNRAGEKINGAVTVAPLTTSLAATVQGSALDATAGKALNDKGSQMSVYKGDDGNLHFRNWAGADTVIPFNGNTEPKEIICIISFGYVYYKSTGDVVGNMLGAGNTSGEYFTCTDVSNDGYSPTIICNKSGDYRIVGYIDFYGIVKRDEVRHFNAGEAILSSVAGANDSPRVFIIAL